VISIKVIIKKQFLGLASVGIILMLLPISLYGNHFRYGTMSWEPISDNGTHVTVRLKMQNGWTSNHSDWSSFSTGDFKTNYVTIYWGDGSDSGATIDFKVLSRDNTTNDTLTEMGDYSSSSWTAGVTHTYEDNGTTEYTAYWGSSARESVENSGNGSAWRNETKINIGGSFVGNSSPVSAVPPVVQVQDNSEFNYQLVSTDADGDSLNYRWGTIAEFFLASSSDSFTQPTGMTLSSSGLVNWDVRDTILCSGCTQNDVNDENDLWVAVVMIEDLHDNGSVKSYIPVDFFFKTANASNDPPSMIGIPTTTQNISIGNTKTFTFTATDDSGFAPTFSVLNPPSDNSSIWSTSTSSSGGTTTFTITFTPETSMDNATYAVNIRATDGDGMTKDQTIGITITNVSNSDPTAPTLVSPANGATVVKPVTFQWLSSTDADNDEISYSLYFCTDSGFAGCSGTTVTASSNLRPPSNQNLRDGLISWPRKLFAATLYYQISQDFSGLHKWIVLLIAFVLLSAMINFSLKNIYNRKFLFMIILMIFFFIVNLNSCAISTNSTSEDNSSSSNDNDDSSTSSSATIGSSYMTYTTSDLSSNGTEYYWKVIAIDTNGGSAESSTLSFTVQ